MISFFAHWWHLHVFLELLWYCNWLWANRNQFGNKFHFTPLIFAVKFMSLSPAHISYDESKVNFHTSTLTKVGCSLIQLQSEMLGTQFAPWLPVTFVLLINFSYLSSWCANFICYDIQTYYDSYSPTFTTLTNILSQFLVLNRNPNPAITTITTTTSTSTWY